MRRVYAKLGRVDRVLRVWVVREGIGVDDLLRELAADDESVLDKLGEQGTISLDMSVTYTHDVPLAPEYQNQHGQRLSNNHIEGTHSEPKKYRSLPRSWTRPATCIHSGFPSLRIASAVCSRCSI